MTDSTCSQCRHWHRQPADPMNLGAPAVGECRLEPKLLAVPTRQGVQLACTYLSTPAAFPACGQFDPPDTAESLEWEADNGPTDTLRCLSAVARQAGNTPLAEGYRWLAERGKWPVRDFEGLWGWNVRHYPDVSDDEEACQNTLPAAVCKRLPGWADSQEGRTPDEPDWRDSASAALRAAAVAVGDWLWEKSNP